MKRRSPLLGMVIWVLAVMGMALGCATPGLSERATGPQTPSLSDLFEEVSPTVVVIYTLERTRGSGRSGTTQAGIGTRRSCCGPIG